MVKATTALAACFLLLAASTLQGCGGDADEDELQKRLDAQPKYDYYIFTPFGNVHLLDEYLDPKIYPLESLLADNDVKGILVLYVMPGKEYQDMLDFTETLVTNPNAPPPASLSTLEAKVKEYMNKHLTDKLKKDGRVRVLTPLDFDQILLSVRHRIGSTAFTKWFGHATYDSPKFCDAVMRVRGVGNSVPVMRLDTGVIFNFHSKGDLSGVATMMKAGVEDYKASMSDVFTQSFMISQLYTGVKKDNGTIPYDTWNEGYATQSVPALLATDDLIIESQFAGPFPGTTVFHPTPEMMEKATNSDVMMKFYGLQEKDDKTHLDTCTPSWDPDDDKRHEADINCIGNAYIGSNPTKAIISGAALASGPGVALDLPPFLHTDLYIMWIDDHLFDKMAQEVMATKRRAPPIGVGKARFPDVRPPPTATPRFALEFYMPTFTMGAVFDKWINAHPDAYLLKFWAEDLPSELGEKLKALKPISGIAQGPFTEVIQEVRFKGKSLTASEKTDFDAELWKTALVRLEDVYWQMSKVPEPDGIPSFATLWATGRVCAWKTLKKYCDATWALTNNPCKGKFCVKAAQGLVKTTYDTKAKTAKTRNELPPMTKQDLNPAMEAKIAELILGANMHLDWIIEWADIVQAIRSVRLGKIMTDISYSHASNTTVPSVEDKLPM